MLNYQFCSLNSNKSENQTILQVILFAIYIAEDYYRSRWEATWFLKSCVDYRVPCPAPGSEVRILAEGEFIQVNNRYFYREQKTQLFLN